MEELRKVKENLEHDNFKLREEIKYLEDNGGRPQRKRSAGRTGSDNEVSAAGVMLLRKENESLKQEVRALKERISQLTRELEQAVA